MCQDTVIAELTEAAESIRQRLQTTEDELDTLAQRREALCAMLEAYQVVLDAHRLHLSQSERRDAMQVEAAGESGGFLDPATMTVKHALELIASQNNGVIKVPAATRQLFSAGFFVDYSGGRDVVHATLRRAAIQNDGWKKTGRGRYERLSGLEQLMNVS